VINSDYALKCNNIFSSNDLCMDLAIVVNY